MSENEEKIEELDIDYTKHWKKYYENIAGERMKEVSKLAKQDEFKIDIYDENSDTWENKTYKYIEIPTKRWMVLEKIRAQYNDLEKLAAQRLINSKEASVYDFQEQLNAKMSELYQRSAEFFLKMSKEEFELAKWTQIKAVIDACTHRTVFTLPN